MTGGMSRSLRDVVVFGSQALHSVPAFSYTQYYFLATLKQNPLSGSLCSLYLDRCERKYIVIRFWQRGRSISSRRDEECCLNLELKFNMSRGKTSQATPESGSYPHPSSGLYTPPHASETRDSETATDKYHDPADN